jgi:hypothetical protein
VVIAAVYMEQNARLQLQAEATGRPVRYLSDGEIERTWEWLPNPPVSERAWGCWEARVADD